MRTTTRSRTFFFIGMSAFALATYAEAADFKVIIAKGVDTPPNLSRGSDLNRGERVVVGTAGLLIARETSGCGMDHVIVGPKSVTLQPTSRECSATVNMRQLTAKLATGDPLVERVAMALPGDGRADTLSPSYPSFVNDPCLSLPAVSEEENGASVRCPTGYLLSGMSCSGRYCDSMRLRCCPYLGGRADREMHNYHSFWISDEAGGDSSNEYTTQDFINGLTCRGQYSDDIFPHAVQSPRFQNTRRCEWTSFFSEEPPAGASCPERSFVAGIRCRGSYCDSLSLQCCGLEVNEQGVPNMRTTVPERVR